MKDNYDDICMPGSISQPTWWDVHGVPRFRKLKENEMKFIRNIKCQSCEKIFVVKMTDVYGCYLGIEEENGYNDIPENWHYGDPPFHYFLNGDSEEYVICAGNTMNSIPEYIWESMDWSKVER